MRVRSSDEVELEVHDLGGQGPVVLFAHATNFHGRVWQPVAAHLLSNIHCYSFDQRGHGDSTPPADRLFEWRGFGDDVLAIVDCLGLERPFGVGHSGGGAALLLAEEARPGTFRALYLFEPIVLPLEPPEPSPYHPLARTALKRREVFESREEALSHFSAKPPFDALDPATLKAYVDHGLGERPEGGFGLKCQPQDEAQVYRMATSHRAFADLGRVRCPVTLACGERTDTIGPSLLEQQAAALCVATVEVLAGLGHLGPLEKPAVVASSIFRSFTPS